MKKINENFESTKYINGNPQLYFNKAIAVQKKAFKIDYAKKKLNQSCKTLISAGYCGGCRDCKLCALQAAHDEVVMILSNPEEAHKRYLAWTANSHKNESDNYGAYRSHDGKGHKTIVMHGGAISPETKQKREIERRIEEMEKIARSHTQRREQKDCLHKMISEREKRKAKWGNKKKDHKQSRYDSRWQ
jgi:hypothetical protein